MEVKTCEQGGVTVLAMEGDLQIHEIDELQSILDEALGRSRSPRAVLDISGVTSVTSYVIALMSFWNAQFKQAGGHFAVSGPSAAARRSMERAGVTEVLAVADTLDEALKKVGA